jgi:GTP-binding protein YchF
MLKASHITWQPIIFHDIAGLVKGASKGEGLGNQFLANIRETDALVHVVRAHTDENIIHPEGRVDPLSDIETINTELILADLDAVERRLEKARKEAKKDKEKQDEVEWLEGLEEHLGKEQFAATYPVHEEALRLLTPLTAKPVLYIVNVEEGTNDIPDEFNPLQAQGHHVIALSCRLEAELSEMDDEDAELFRQEMELEASSLDQVVQESYKLLDLITFFTVGEGKEAKAYALEKEATAWQATGKIHSDIQKGFAKAELIGWQELLDAGGWVGARERGVLRIEGRDYVMSDGEVMTVKFA